jgi:hypothetical protein
VLIAGVARSGSTALDCILGNRPDSASLGEIYAWYRPFRPHHLCPTCTCGRDLAHCPVWSRIGRPPARHLHRTVADVLGVDVVVDSSKNLNWIRDAYRWARTDDMNVHVVLAWRGTKALAHSYWKRGFVGWADNLEGYVGRLMDLRLPWRTLDFEALVTEPEQALATVYEPMHLRFVPGQERFWEGQFHSLFGSGATRDQVSGGASRLFAPDYPKDFEDYWSGLPADVRARMDQLDATARAGREGEPARSPIPPPWYLKGRAITALDRVKLRLHPRTKIR